MSIEESAIPDPQIQISEELPAEIKTPPTIRPAMLSEPEEDLAGAIGKIIEQPEVQRRHTMFQLKYFILGREPTIQARLRKCVVELIGRKENIENLRLAIEDLQDDIELANIDIEAQEIGIKKVDTDLKKRISEINIRKARRKRKALESELRKIGKRLQETEEEATFFLQAYRDLEKAESLKPFDDFETNVQYWNERYTEELKLRLLLQKPIDLELAKSILALDKSAPIRAEFIDILTQIEAQALAQKKLIEQGTNRTELEGPKDEDKK